jgi:hypothetical protein
MSADTLRRAASLMRQRAESAPAGSWDVDEIDAIWVDHDPHGTSSSCLVDRFPMWAEGAGEHIASWHPAVALAVADWLDATAAENDAPANSPLAFLNFIGADALAAIAVATAYLNEETP